MSRSSLAALPQTRPRASKGSRASPLPPAAGTVSGGGSLVVAAFDARGHRLDFAWSPAPAACGSLTPAGEAVNFVASPDAGGLTCQLRAVFGGGGGGSAITGAPARAAPAP